MPIGLGLWANPIPLIAGRLLTAGFDVAPIDYLSFGCHTSGVTAVSQGPSSVALNEAGLHVAWYGSGFSAPTSVYGRAFWNLQSYMFSSLQEGASLQGDYQARSLGTVVGYRWRFDSGFTVSAAVGVQYHYLSKRVDIVSADLGTTTAEAGQDYSISQEFTIGWSF